jgi:CBS domain-containing protein
MKLVPDLVHDQHLSPIAPSATVREAAKSMAERNIGAALVVEGGRLLGIFSERDLMNRVIARGLDPDLTKVEEVMTRNPETLPPQADIREAMRLMVQRGFRHIPVVDGHKVVGIVSERDIFANVVKNMQSGVSAAARLLLQG